ncbi:MAG: hypothetical protein L0G22_02830 [Propionibacteriaceae bacterium]|nr:hypothetical protein [Propionibacteriaceae bacterium]
MRQYIVRLAGQAGPTETLRAQDLARLCTAAQTLVYRLYRASTAELDRGRQVQAVEQLSTLSVSIPTPGELVFTVGDEAVLDLDPLAAQVDALAWRIAQGLAANERPTDLPDTIADAVGALIRALARAADHATFIVPDHGEVELATAQLAGEPWGRRNQRTLRTVVGELQMADLRSDRCRIVAGDGVVIELHHVRGITEAAKLVGTQVQATGWFTEQLHGRGRLDVMGTVSTAVEQDSLPWEDA